MLIACKIINYRRLMEFPFITTNDTIQLFPFYINIFPMTVEYGISAIHCQSIFNNCEEWFDVINFMDLGDCVVMETLVTSNVSY